MLASIHTVTTLSFLFTARKLYTVMLLRYIHNIVRRSLGTFYIGIAQKGLYIPNVQTIPFYLSFECPFSRDVYHLGLIDILL
jgi:hypothetical protein